MNTQTITTITFEFHGQDFDKWDIHPNGTVIACRPMQSRFWVGRKVTNLAALEIGSLVEYKSNGRLLSIKYPILAITKREVPCE